MKDMVLAAVINVFWMIWHYRNKLRFENRKTTFHQVINLIVAQVSMIENFSRGTMSSSVSELSILRAFSVSGHMSLPPTITKVTWLPPPCNWIKCNLDGAACGVPGGLLVGLSLDTIDILS